MPQKSLVSHVKLSQYATYDQDSDALERCPSCHNERLSKTPRRGPALFHCRRCGFIANMDDVHEMRRMLGQRAV